MKPNTNSDEQNKEQMRLSELFTRKKEITKTILKLSNEKREINKEIAKLIDILPLKNTPPFFRIWLFS